MVTEPQGISLKPSDSIEVSGLLNDEDVVIKSMNFCMWDYKGKSVNTPAIQVVFGGREGADDVVQYYSVGKASDWMPSKDGKRILPIGKATGIANNSNAMLFLTSIVNAGFDENEIGNDITIFNGMEVHVIRIAVDRKDLPDAKGDKKAPTLLTVSKILALPGDKKGKGKGKGKAATKTADEATTLATEFIGRVLDTNPDGVPMAKLPTMAFQDIQLANIDMAVKNKVIELVFDAEFHKAGSWNFDGKSITKA